MKLHEKLRDFMVSQLLVKTLLVCVVLTAAVGALTTYLNENLDVLRTSYVVANARRKLRTGDPDAIGRAVSTLVEVARNKPYRKQEMVDIIVQELFRKWFARTPGVALPPTPPAMVGIFRDSLRALLSIPRKDENDHSINIDLHQLALVGKKENPIYLQKTNFKDVVLWGSEFVNVALSRSDFENADLGGVRFEACGMEDLNLKNARMSYSFLDDRATIIQHCEVARSTIDESLIITGTRVQLSIRAGEIDLERCARLACKAPMVEMVGQHQGCQCPNPRK